MQMSVGASLPSQSLNGITKKIGPIAQQVSTHTDAIMFPLMDIHNFISDCHAI